MATFPTLPRSGRKRVLAAFLATAFLAGGPALAFSPILPPAAIGSAERIHVAQSAESAQLAVRIQQLEEQIRILTGQIEGLTFQLTQMQTLIERMQEDNEFRFSALEGGAPANPNGAGTGSGGAMPSGASPQDGQDVAPTIVPEQGVVPLPGEQEFDPMFDDGTFGPDGAELGGDFPPSPDGVGASADPLLGTGQGANGVVLGTLPAGAEVFDLSFDPSAATPNRDADVQFAAAYEALVNGDVAFAEDQLTQFIALYPENPRIPEAADWLGQIKIGRGENEAAAELLLDVYQSAPDAAHAPDLLLRLGTALAGAGERDTACRTFSEILGRYPALEADFRARLEAERAQAECPPA